MMTTTSEWFGRLGGVLFAMTAAVGAAVGVVACGEAGGAAAGTAPAGGEPADGEAGRVLIVLTNHAELGETGEPTGFFLSEASHPWEVFTEAGYAVDFASPEGGEAPIDPKSMDRGDPANAAFLDDQAVMTAVGGTPALGEVDVSGYDGIFFAGGHGTVWDFPGHAAVNEKTAAVYEQGGAVGAVCHGPAALVDVQLADGTYLVDGKRVAAFTNAEEEAVGLAEVVPFLLADRLTARGAEHVPGENFEKNVVVDGRLVTGQNPASAKGAAEEMVRVMEKADRR